jgi:hypothetical protein
MFLILMTSVIGLSANGTIADLLPHLREALLHDAACTPSSPQRPPTSNTSVNDPEASNPDAARAQLLESQVDIQEIRGTPGGVIAAPQGDCSCAGSSCAIYVYLKDGQAYRLSFKREFTSLHPMKVYKRGMPSLTGKLEISDTQAETRVYDWNGQQYEASLCATVTQGRNQRLPSIARHECGKVH